MKFYLLNPQGIPPNPHLFPVWVHAWKANGVEIVDRIEDAEVVLMDLHTRIADYNESDICWLRNKSEKLVTFCEWDRGSLSTDQWPLPLTGQQQDVFSELHLGRIGSLHFCRLLNKTKTYPKNIYPYEKAIIYEEPLVTPDELFNREFDVVFIANSAPSRMAIAEALQHDHRLKTFISIGAEKKPFDEFVRWHKRGKLFISSAAGGYGDERVQSLFSIAGIIKQNTDQLFLHEFVHLQNSIKIDSPPTKEQLDLIYEIVNDEGRLYDIYKRGYEFVKRYYSASYIAIDILSKIKKHLAAP